MEEFRKAKKKFETDLYGPNNAEKLSRSARGSNSVPPSGDEDKESKLEVLYYTNIFPFAQLILKSKIIRTLPLLFLTVHISKVIKKGMLKK